MPRSSNTATLSAAAIRRAAPRNVSSSTPQRAAYVGDRQRAELGHDGRPIRRRGRAPSRCAPGLPARCTATIAERQNASVPGPHLQVEAAAGDGEFRRLAAPRIDDDDRPRRVVGDLLQRGARPREAVALPRVLADEQRHLAVLEVGAHATAEHLAVDPELAGLLLRQRVGAVAAAERTQGGAAVAATEMVALPAAAVIEDRLAAVGVAHRREALGDLADRGVPVDLLERAVGAATQRREQAARVPFW